MLRENDSHFLEKPTLYGDRVEPRLHRITFALCDFNPRVRRVYEKVGEEL